MIVYFNELQTLYQCGLPIECMHIECVRVEFKNSKAILFFDENDLCSIYLKFISKIE